MLFMDLYVGSNRYSSVFVKVDCGSCHNCPGA